MKQRIAAMTVVGLTVLLVSACGRSTVAAEPSAKPEAAAKRKTPEDRVVVMYFHRTQRCPTCLKMGGFAEEAVRTGFARELKDGKVEFHSIDFQDKKNEALTKGYQVSGPTLIVAKVVKGKVKERKSLTEMWTKVRDKAAFTDYVRSNVQESLKAK